MASLVVGRRVSIRYRLPAGEHTDVIGHVVAVSPRIALRTKAGETVEIDPADVLAARELSRVTVRNSQIRAVEHAAALAWPGLEQHWQDGWLLRAAHGHTSRANSAVPLAFSAGVDALPVIADWYSQRGLEPWLALPERLLAVRANGIKNTRVMVVDLSGNPPSPDVELLDRPDERWLALYERDVPAAVLSAVVEGEVVFAMRAGAAVGRGAVTAAPDGTRWLGIAAVQVAELRRGQGHARAVCRALLGWGAGRGATRAYVQVLTDNAAAVALYESLGFGLHHHHRYVDARDLLARTL